VLLTRGEDIAPIPGTRRIARVEENTAADPVQLTPEQIERLNTLRPPPANGTTKPTWRQSIGDRRFRYGVAVDGAVDGERCLVVQ
jgi:diketogulonate reductase-like aldo/keto reductase